MYLVSLSMENFRQHKETYLQFSRGLTGILGANGAGKSTVLEAIAWALYGNQHGVLRGNKDSLLWRQAPGKTEAIVTLTFVFDQVTYKVKRSQGVSRSTAQLWRDNTLLANALKAVDEQLAQLLRMTHQEFFNSYFTGQKDLLFLGSIRGATDRERFIARMLGYEKITEIQGAANKENTIRYDLRNKQREKDKLEGSISNYLGITDRVAQQQATLQQLQQNLLQVEQELQQITEAKQKIETQWKVLNDRHAQYRHHRATLEGYQLRSGALSREIGDLETRSSALQTALEKYYLLEKEVANFSALQTEFQALSTQQQQLMRMENIQERIKILQQEMTGLATELQGLDRIEVEVSTTQEQMQQLQIYLQTTEADLQEQTKQWQEQQAQLRAEIAVQKQSLQKTKSQHRSIVDAGEEGVCPTCERALKEEFLTVVDRFETQITQLQQHICDREVQEKQLLQSPDSMKILERSRQEYRQQLQAAQQKLIAINASLSRKQLLANHYQLKQAEHQQLATELSAVPTNFNRERFMALQQQLQVLQPKQEAFLRASQTPEQYRLVQTSLTEKQQEFTQLQAKQREITEQIHGLQFVEADFQVLQEKVKLTQEKFEGIQHQHQSLAQQVAIALHSLQQLQEQEKEYQEKQKLWQILRSECLVLEELDNAFTDLRQHLTEQIRPQLAESASLFLSQLTEGRYTSLAIDERYQVIVEENDEPKPIISGGEEDIVNLSLRLAISQMITQRSGQPFSLLILDEIFGSLDEGRRDNVIQLLHSLEEQFEQVLIITHIESIKESLNQCIRIYFDPEQQCSRLL